MKGNPTSSFQFPKLIVDTINPEFRQHRHVTRFKLTRKERHNLQLFLLKYDVRKTFRDKKYDKYLLSDLAFALEGPLYVMELQLQFFQRLEFNSFYGVLYGKEYQERIRSEFEISLSKPITFGLNIFDLPNLLSKNKYLRFTSIPNDFTLYNILLNWRIGSMKLREKKHKEKIGIIPFTQNSLSKFTRSEDDPICKILENNKERLENEKLKNKETDEDEDRAERNRQIVKKTMEKFREKADRANERISKTRPFIYVFLPVYNVVKRVCVFTMFMVMKSFYYYYKLKASIQHPNYYRQSHNVNIPSQERYREVLEKIETNRKLQSSILKYNEEEFKHAIQEYFSQHNHSDYYNFDTYNESVIKNERQMMKAIKSIKNEISKLKQMKSSQAHAKESKEIEEMDSINFPLVMKTFKKLIKQHKEILPDSKLAEMIPTSDLFIKEKVNFYKRMMKSKKQRVGAVWKLRSLFLRHSIFPDHCNNQRIENTESIKFFHYGSSAFESMIQSIREAKTRIWLEIYIMEPDPIGLEFIKELTNAVKRGVQVILLFDYFGSIKISYYLQPLIDAGGFAIAYGRPLQGGHLFKRNHRKILIIDDEAYVGGLNLAKEYSEKYEGKEAFVDLHSKISGFCVHQIAALYLNSLREARVNPKFFIQAFETNEKFLQSEQRTPCYFPYFQYHEYTYPKEILFPSHLWDDKIGIYLFDNGDGRAAAQYALKQAIANCKKYAYLVTPYFLPPRDLEDTIMKALKRGVEVRILTAGKSEVLGVNLAAKTVYRKYLKNGAKIYECRDYLLHAKYFTFDGEVGLYGSFNMDGISWNRNLEVLLRIHGASCVSELENRFEMDVTTAHQVTMEELNNKPLWQRAGGKFAAFFWKFFWSTT